MKRHTTPKEFIWDTGNVDKSYKKHGITPNESEEVFLDENVQIVSDVRHSKVEKRYIAIGKCVEEKILFIVFTFRRTNIRVISARTANKKERGFYEEKIKRDSGI